MANVFNRELVRVATFDLINTSEWVDEHIYRQIPEKEPFSMPFDRQEIESTLLISNISVVLWMYILHSSIFVVVFLPIVLLHRCFGLLSKQRSKMQKYFLWGGLLRLFIETFLELSFASLLNTYTRDKSAESWPEIFSNVLSIAIISIILAFLCCAGLYIVLKRQLRKNSFLAIFFIRRAAFACSVVFLKDYFWVQIASQTLCQVLMFAFFTHFKPMDSPFLNRMEAMSEVTTLGLLYGLLCFTIAGPGSGYLTAISVYYICVIAGSLLVNITFLLKTNCLRVKLLCKRRCGPRPNKKLPKKTISSKRV